MFWTVRLSHGRQNQIGQSSMIGGGGGGAALGAGGVAGGGNLAFISNQQSSPPLSSSLRTNDFNNNNNTNTGTTLANVNVIDSDQDLIDDNFDDQRNNNNNAGNSLLQPPQQPPRKRSLVQALLNSANFSINPDQSGNQTNQSIKMFMDSSGSSLQTTGTGLHNYDHSLDLDNYGLPYFFGDPLGIHDPSEAELGGVGHENVGPFVKRSRKILRGLLLMIIVAICWVAVIHLFRISFHRDRILYSISGGNFNLTKLFSLSSSNINMNNNNNNIQQQPTISPKNIKINNQIITNGQNNNNFKNLNETNLFEMLPSPMSLASSKGPKSKPSSLINEYPRSNFDAPYLVTWYCSIWNIFYLPVYLMIHSYFLSRRTKPNPNDQQQQQQQSGSNSGGSSAISNNPFGSNISNNKSAGSSSIATDNTASSSTSMKKVLIESIQGIVDRGFTLMQFFSRCAFFCALCTLSNYMLIFSLRILDATVVMALFASTVSLIYLLSWVVLHQQFVGIRIVGIIVVDTGVALLVYMDGIQNQTLATVMIAFGSAIVYAVYKVFMRRMIGYTTFAQMALFHSLVGALNLLLAWPLILILYATGVERIVWSEIPWLFMTGASLCSLIANLIASFGIICTYEFFITLGMFFAIPISAVIDIYLNSVIFRDMKLGGVLLILIGILIVLLPDNWNGYLTNAFRNRLKKWKRREENKKNGRVQDTSTGQLSRLRTSSGRVK